jgi:hypothetical protein
VDFTSDGTLHAIDVASGANVDLGAIGDDAAPVWVE